MSRTAVIRATARSDEATAKDLDRERHIARRTRPHRTGAIGANLGATTEERRAWLAAAEVPALEVRLASLRATKGWA